MVEVNRKTSSISEAIPDVADLGLGLGRLLKEQPEEFEDPTGTAEDRCEYPPPRTDTLFAEPSIDEQLETRVADASQMGRPLTVIVLGLVAKADRPAHSLVTQQLLAFSIQNIRHHEVLGRHQNCIVATLEGETALGGTHLAQRLYKIWRSLPPSEPGAETLRIGIASLKGSVSSGQELLLSAIHMLFSTHHGFSWQGRMGLLQGSGPSSRHPTLKRQQLEAVGRRFPGLREYIHIVMVRQALFVLDMEKTRLDWNHACLGAELALSVARHIRLAKREQVRILTAALLRDLGMALIPSAVLNETGALSRESWAIMEYHPVASVRAIERQLSLHPEIILMVLYHHERFDGSGYPEKKVSQSIPLGARIIAVADAYAAMTAHRAHRRARTSSEAIQELGVHSGSHFDPAIIEHFRPPPGPVSLCP